MSERKSWSRIAFVIMVLTSMVSLSGASDFAAVGCASMEAADSLFMASTGVSHAREEDVPHFSNHPIEKPGTGQACRVNLRRPGAAHTPTTHTHDAGVPGRNEKESMLAQPVKGHTSSSVTLQPLLLDKDLMYETRLLPLQPHAEDRLLRDGERLPLIRFSGARIYLGEPVATEATEVLEP